MSEPTKTESMMTSQPADLKEAAATEAKRRGVSLSAFVGEAIRKALPRKVREGLAERPQNGGVREGAGRKPLIK